MEKDEKRPHCETGAATSRKSIVKHERGFSKKPTWVSPRRSLPPLRKGPRVTGDIS